MSGRRGTAWARIAVVATAMLFPAPGAVSLAQKSPAPEAQVAPRDPFSMPPDARATKPAETRRTRWLFSTASGLEARGDYREAEQYRREALATNEASWGPHHPVTAIGLNNLAENLRSQGRYADAEQLLRRALAIYKARLGADHPYTATSLNNLAVNVSSQGRYADAEPLYRQALAIDEARLGADHPSTAIGLDNLASNLRSQGRYVDAEPLQRRALGILETRLGANHPDTTTALANLAVNLYRQGRYADAEPLYRRALAIDEVRFGADHPETARGLNNLAENLSSQGRYTEAEPLFRRALAINEARLGADHPKTAAGLNNLAANLRSQGRYADAEPLQRRALAIIEARLGPDHPDTATTLNNLAENLYFQGRYSDAEPLYRQALAIRESRLGPNHPDTAQSDEGSALVELRLSRFDAALTHARSALHVRQDARTAAGLATAEDTHTQLADALGDSAAIFSRAAWSAGVGRSGFAAALRTEAFAAVQSIRVSSSSDALAQGVARIAAERAGAGPGVAAWRGAQTRTAAIDGQITQAAAQGAAGDARRAVLSTERTAAIEQLATAERELALRFPRYFDLLKTVPVIVADLQSTTGDNARLLGPDEALVVLTSGDRRLPEGQRRGLVFVVTKETSAWAEIPLEPKALGREIGALHTMLAAEGAGATTTGQSAPTVIYNRARAFALYKALFGNADIQAALVGKSRWLIAPQGALMSLPFAALPMASPQGSDTDPAALRATAWLGIERTLAVIPSVSALRVQRLLPLDRAQTQRVPFFGVGDPAFRGVPDSDVRSAGSATLQSARSYFRGAVADLSTFARLPRLENTAREIRQLAINLGAGPESYVLQLNATEAELRRRNADGRLARAEIVAFATHGLVSGEFQNSIAEPALALTPPVVANGQLPTSNNDGLLTASEAATLTLSARFVILSACNTASGGQPDADSLSGLARAFFYAGAQSLLVSHYPVFDDAAMRLTTEAGRLARMEGQRNPEAMRASMTALMQDVSADASGRSFSHPTQWAPFAVIDAN